MSAVCVHIYRLIKGLSAMVKSGSGRIQRQLPANLVHGLSPSYPSILILMSNVRLNTATVATWTFQNWCFIFYSCGSGNLAGENMLNTGFSVAIAT